MTLPRKDIRAKLGAEQHALLTVLCEVDQVDIGEFVERELERVIWERVHAATVLADVAQRLGISGNRRERQGTAGKNE